MDQCINKMLHIETGGGIFDEIVDCNMYYYVVEKSPKRRKCVHPIKNTKPLKTHNYCL